MISCAVKITSDPAATTRPTLCRRSSLLSSARSESYEPSKSVEAYILEIARRVRISSYRKEAALKRGGGNPGASGAELPRVQSRRGLRARSVPDG